MQYISTDIALLAV